MKECESYGLNKAVIYEECDDKLPVVDESTTDDKPVKSVVVDEPPATAAAPPVIYEAFATDDVIHHVDDINIYET